MIIKVLSIIDRCPLDLADCIINLLNRIDLVIHPHPIAENMLERMFLREGQGRKAYDERHHRRRKHFMRSPPAGTYLPSTNPACLVGDSVFPDRGKKTTYNVPKVVHAGIVSMSRDSQLRNTVG